MTTHNTFEIYTDGACVGNPGPGGYAAVIKIDNHETIVVGQEPSTTSNRMEMLAAIKALETLSSGAHVTIYSDSQYLIHGMTKWLIGWKAKGWRTASKTPVKNQDLWEALDRLNQIHQLSWKWIKGHAGHAENERADALANEQARAAARSLNLSMAPDDDTPQDGSGPNTHSQAVMPMVDSSRSVIISCRGTEMPMRLGL